MMHDLAVNKRMMSTAPWSKNGDLDALRALIQDKKSKIATASTKMLQLLFF